MTWQAWIALGLLGATIAFATTVAILTHVINDARHGCPVWTGDYEDRWQS